MSEKTHFESSSENLFALINWNPLRRRQITRSNNPARSPSQAIAFSGTAQAIVNSVAVPLFGTGVTAKANPLFEHRPGRPAACLRQGVREGEGEAFLFLGAEETRNRQPASVRDQEQP